MLTRTDQDSGLLQALTDGKVIMGLYPVLFGWRVRAGRVGELVYHCDWCCGADEKVVWGTYGIMKILLERFELERLPRCSQVKPWNKDPQFIAELAVLMNGDDVPMLRVEHRSLQQMRREWFSRLEERPHG